MKIDLDREKIEEILPHRDPFLFVDGVTSINVGQNVEGFLNVNETKSFLSGEVSDRCLSTAILMEAMAQVGAILVLYPMDQRCRTIYFRSIKNAQFYRRIPSGSTVRIEARVDKIRTRMGSLYVTARADDTIVADAMMSFALA